MNERWTTLYSPSWTSPYKGTKARMSGGVRDCTLPYAGTTTRTWPMVEQMEKSQKWRWIDGWRMMNSKKGVSSRVCTSVMREKTVEKALR